MIFKFPMELKSCASTYTQLKNELDNWKIYSIISKASLEIILITFLASIAVKIFFLLSFPRINTHLFY